MERRRQADGGPHQLRGFQEVHGGGSSELVEHGAIGEYSDRGTALRVDFRHFHALRRLAVPAITSLAPNPVDAGGDYFRATVTGTGFIPTSVVNWAGTPLDTIYVSATQLQAGITPELRTLAGTFP